MVLEFYSNYRERRFDSNLTAWVPIRNGYVAFSPAIIDEFFDLPKKPRKTAKVPNEHFGVL